jgi:hypothetical protein
MCDIQDLLIFILIKTVAARRLEVISSDTTKKFLMFEKHQA